MNPLDQSTISKALGSTMHNLPTGQDSLRAWSEMRASGIDNPAIDGTDYAHPAWWRGNDAGVVAICRMVNDILDGKDDGAGVANEPWESTRRRIAGLRAENNRLRRILAHVPGKVAIIAKEAAGFGECVIPKGSAND